MSTAQLSAAEIDALSFVMSARYDNVVETRQQTGDDEYDLFDEDMCSALTFWLSDWGASDDARPGSLQHLYDAIWVALDTPEGFEEVDFDALRSGAAKVGYDELGRLLDDLE